MLALAACGGSDNAVPDAAIDAAHPDSPKVWNDAPPVTYDLSCSGNSAPATAAAQITITGVVREAGLGGEVPVEGATLKVCKVGAADCTGSNQVGTDATSAATGDWSIGPLDTSSMPDDLYVAMTAGNVRTTYTYSPAPLVADLSGLPIRAMSSSLLSFLSSACPQDDTTKGIVIILVTDCTGTPIADAANITLSVKQGGTEVTGTSVLDFGQLKASLAGTFLVCNVPANAVTEVNATYKTTTFLPRPLEVIAGTTSNTRVRPGY